jgi:UDP-N-acetylmuramoyl-L-alanyl-D-glutamate--2,6-diaminopimelate ligase
MKFKEVLRDCDFVRTSDWGELPEDLNISGIAYDSRSVKEAYLFVAVKGERFDGHDFIRNAIMQGACVIVHEQETDEQSPAAGLRNDEGLSGFRPLFFLRALNSRRALACLANNFYERPSERLTVTGITGTNGKTTTTYILKSILEQWGHTVGLIGTIQYMIKDKVYPAVHTTPEAPEFHHLLRDMLESGCTDVISEVSSHALEQYRVDGTVFRSAVFTNLTRDHLDFHRTMDGYFLAKKRLFTDLVARGGVAVINTDDPFGKALHDDLHPLSQDPLKLNLLSYGLQPEADIMACDVDNSFQGLRFRAVIKGRSLAISSPLIGLINVYNILAAVGAAVSLNIPAESIIEGIRVLKPVPGRFEKIDLGQGFLCVVDYAHTEDALARLISTARELLQKSSCSGRIITVFGCGGDRDRGKRPSMGAVATGSSDFVFITSDNPRSEEPGDIIRDIESGTVKKDYLVVPDRRHAILKAIDMAEAGDIVLIAGKGHEDYQEIKGARLPFSDREVASGAIRKRMQNASADL